MSTDQLILVALAVFVAAAVYIIAGFGFALLAMPLMTLRIPVEDAVVITALLAMLSTWWQAITLREHVHRPLVVRMSAASYVGMPLGLLTLNVVNDRSLKIALGAIVLVATAMLARDVDFSHLGRGFDASMGFMSGVLSTSVGTNGPPLVFGLQTRQLAPDSFRATIAWVFALGNLFAMLLFALDGKITQDGARVAVLAVPAWLAGLWIGLQIRPRVPPAEFRSLVLVLLALTGVTTIGFAIV